MADLIDEVGIDAKHSFENAILPVTRFQEALWRPHRRAWAAWTSTSWAGRRPATVRTEVRRLIETCHPRGRFAIGSGNSIPSYVPVENYLAMIDEALR